MQQSNIGKRMFSAQQMLLSSNCNRKAETRRAIERERQRQRQRDKEAAAIEKSVRYEMLVRATQS